MLCALKDDLYSISFLGHKTGSILLLPQKALFLGPFHSLLNTKLVDDADSIGANTQFHPLVFGRDKEALILEIRFERPTGTAL